MLRSRTAAPFWPLRPIGLLGGLIGLGGAEFRLPVLKAVFGYGSRRAVPANLCVSLITVGTALAVRLGGGGAMVRWTRWRRP